MGNHAARLISICSPAPAACLSQPCPRRFWPTLGSWLLPQRCTCWARLAAGMLCRPGPDYTAACREGTHPQSKEAQNKQAHRDKTVFFFPYLYKKNMCKCLTSCNMWLIRQTTAGWLPLPDAFAPGWAKSPPGSEGRPGGWLQHRSQASPGITDRCSAQIANGVTAASAELTLVTCSRNSGLERQSCVEPQFVV